MFKSYERLATHMQTKWLIALTFGLGGTLGSGFAWLAIGNASATPSSKLSSTPRTPPAHKRVALIRPAANGSENVRFALSSAPQQLPMSAMAREQDVEVAREQDVEEVQGKSLALTLAGLEEQYRALTLALEAQRQADIDLVMKHERAVQEERDLLQRERAVQEERDLLQHERAVQEEQKARLIDDEQHVDEAQVAVAANSTVQIDSHVENNQTQYVTLNNYTPVYIGGQNQPFRIKSQPHSSTLSNQFTMMSQAQQRANLSPVTTQIDVLAGGPGSPWAPIDMTGRHNPWPSNRLP